MERNDVFIYDGKGGAVWGTGKAEISFLQHPGMIIIQTIDFIAGLPYNGGK